MKKIVFPLLFLFLFLVGIGSAYAVNLVIETTDASGNGKTTFVPGDELYVNILVDEQADVAGAVFTLDYPNAVLDPPATNGDGVSPDISSPFDFFSFDDGGTTVDTHRANSSTTAGKILFAGATINPNDGGGKTVLFMTPIFRAKFMVDAGAGSGAYTLSLTETTLNNPDAGWNNAQSPVLVGALADTDPDFGGDLGDDFPVLLATLSSPVEAEITISDSTCLNGDYDGDGQLTVFDALDTYSYSRGTSTADPVCNVEVDGEPPITVFDALKIYQCSRGQDTCN